jgi:hypothetical protein
MDAFTRIIELEMAVSSVPKLLRQTTETMLTGTLFHSSTSSRKCLR